MVQVSSPSPRYSGARRSLRRLLLGGSAPLCLFALTALSAVPAAASAGAPPPVRDEDRAGDHLTVTVRNAGEGRDGTYELYCHPDGGSHPDARGACGALDRNTRWGRDTFAPVPDGSICTMQYGGPATAHVTGTWAGRPVDASYDRGDGCRIARWNRLVPLLPDLGSQDGRSRSPARATCVPPRAARGSDRA
ncbi:SSI family serine proteinase inhibitor [Streptomyces sp. NPDC020801]|uniref:SSI family serine proteinase inhibitor n=1 Tax=unclassified Streptomyces TaxID=2593676 RepID=UPI0037A63422